MIIRLNWRLAIGFVVAATPVTALAQGKAKVGGGGMNWPDWMLSAGLLIGLAGAALALRQV